MNCIPSHYYVAPDRNSGWKALASSSGFGVRNSREVKRLSVRVRNISAYLSILFDPSHCYVSSFAKVWFTWHTHFLWSLFVSCPVFGLRVTLGSWDGGKSWVTQLRKWMCFDHCVWCHSQQWTVYSASSVYHGPLSPPAAAASQNRFCWLYDCLLRLLPARVEFNLRLLSQLTAADQILIRFYWRGNINHVKHVL